MTAAGSTWGESYCASIRSAAYNGSPRQDTALSVMALLSDTFATHLMLLDMSRPMLADSGDERLGLAPLRKRFAGDVILYANDLHNATPASGALVGSTLFKGRWVRGVTLGVFRRFGCRVWVHQPGKPFLHRQKLAERAQPGSFLGFEHPLAPVCARCFLATVASLSIRHCTFVPPPALLPEKKGEQLFLGPPKPPESRQPKALSPLPVLSMIASDQCLSWLASKCVVDAGLSHVLR
jgi:hypothetical protein